MTRQPARYVLSLAALSLLLAGCSDDKPQSAEAGTSSPATAEPSTPTGPTSLRDYAGSIVPGTHRVPLIRWDRTYPVDAVVEVPAGFITPGGWVIENGKNGTAYGDLMFFGDVDRVDTNPCGAGRLAKPGPTVRDLADALFVQVGHRATTPKPVTVGGHRGLYVETTAPRDLSSCDGERFALWKVDIADPFEYDVNQPGTVVRLWIIDVDGQRVVVAVKFVPGHTTHAGDFVRMAETATFVENVDG